MGEKRFGMSKPDTLDNQSSLCDDEGPIPEFPALAVDSSSGRRNQHAITPATKKVTYQPEARARVR